MKWMKATLTVYSNDVESVMLDLERLLTDGAIESPHEDNPAITDIIIYLPPERTAIEWQGFLGNLLTQEKITLLNSEILEVSDESWLYEWQQYIPPIELLPSLVIRPVWQSYEPSIGDTVFLIDSKLSFGLGDHETTRACATLMKRYGLEAQSCLDIGTGTGILLLVAAYLKIPRLFGIDIEEEAARQAQQNLALNEITGQIYHGNLDEAFHDKADLIVANLTVNPLKVLLPHIVSKLEEHGILIISGIIDERREEIMPYILDYWTILEELVDGVWHTFALARK